MSDVKTALGRAADRHEPPKDWLDRIRARAHSRRRNRRVLAGGVGLGLAVVVIAGLLGAMSTRDPAPPADARPPDDRCESGIDVAPTGWWRADGSPVDAAGGRDAVLRRQVTYAPGLIGEAFSLDGEHAFVEVPDDPALNVGMDDFTIALWVRFRVTKTEQVLAEDWVQLGRDSVGWTFQTTGNGGLLFALGAKAGSVGTPRLDLPTDSWIHLAARRRAGFLSILVNGDVVARAVLADETASVDSPSSLKFGHRGGPRDTPGALFAQGFFLDGELDEIQLYVGRGLSNARIRQLVELQSACAT